MDLDYVLTRVAARLAHNCQQHLVKSPAGFRIPNRPVVEPMRLQPVVFALVSDKNRRCDPLRIRTTNANDPDSTFACGRGYGCNRILFVHEKADLS
jgi:hypothetical protein